MLLLERDMSVVNLQTPMVGTADQPDVPCWRLECHHSASLPERDNPICHYSKTTFSPPTPSVLLASSLKLARCVYNTRWGHLPILRTIGQVAEENLPNHIWPSEHWGSDSTSQDEAQKIT